VGLACWNEPSLRKEHVSDLDYFNIYISVPYVAAAVATLLYLGLQVRGDSRNIAALFLPYKFIILALFLCVNFPIIAY
jgi:hypothetical protein